MRLAHADTVLEQARERTKAVVGLVEARPLALERLRSDTCPGPSLQRFAQRGSCWLQAVVRHNPVTHLTHASRGLMHGTPVGADILWVLVASAAAAPAHASGVV